MKLAYIIGPYRAPTPYQIQQNINNAERAALKLWKMGYCVICPHKNSAHLDGECPDSTWLDGYLEIFKRCDLGVIFDGYGNSEGSRKEIDLAYYELIPIIHIDENAKLKNFLKNFPKER